MRESSHIDGDFDKYVSDRNMKDYTTALMWCRVFLQGKSFSAFAGSKIAFALLFPMETLFESYIAYTIRKCLSPHNFSVSVQEKSYHLFDTPRQFLMKPDIVVKRKQDGMVFVLDTKWKLLSQSKANYGISQADMYQMYAYQKKYQAERVFLLYPTTDTMSSDRHLSFQSNDGVVVSAEFIDLINIQRSLCQIVKEME